MKGKYSQNNEDVLVEAHFRRERQDTLTCLDIGANDGVTLSNTCACIERGWTALMVEPSPRCVERLRERYGGNEKVHVLPVAVADEDGLVTLWESGSHLSPRDHSLVSTLRASEMKRWTKEQFTPITVEARRFAAVEGFAESRGIQTFDLISIDVEGFDYDVLSQIDLGRWRCRMLIVENNGREEKKFVEYCAAFGGRLHAKNAENLIFVLS